MRLLKLAVAALAVGYWWQHGGREYVLGDPETMVGEGMKVLRGWVVVKPPTFHHTFTTGSTGEMVGMTVIHDGEEIGEILEAERTDIGWARVRYEVARAPLGFPITVAVSEAELAVSQAVAETAIAI